MQYKYKYHPGH